MFTSLDLPSQEQRVNQWLRLGPATEYIRTNSALEQHSETIARFLPYDFHIWSRFEMTHLSGFLNYLSDFTKRAQFAASSSLEQDIAENCCFNWPGINTALASIRC